MNWEYKNHPNHEAILTERTVGILASMWDGTLDLRSALIDTRSIHQQMFRGLTPPGYEHFAGHYRGESFPGLNQRVGILSNPSVGYPAEHVLQVMAQFSKTVGRGIDDMDALHQSSELLGQKLRKTISFVCAAFVRLNHIHPYMNGNGHIARFMLVAGLKRYGYEIKSWTIEPRPTDPPYTNLIRQYEGGDKEPLLCWIAQHIHLH